MGNYKYKTLSHLATWKPVFYATEHYKLYCRTRIYIIIMTVIIPTPHCLERKVTVEFSDAWLTPSHPFSSLQFHACDKACDSHLELLIHFCFLCEFHMIYPEDMILISYIYLEYKGKFWKVLWIDFIQKLKMKVDLMFVSTWVSAQEWKFSNTWPLTPCFTQVKYHHAISPGTISKRCRLGSSWLAGSSLTWLPWREIQPCKTKETKTWERQTQTDTISKHGEKTPT